MHFAFFVCRLGFVWVSGDVGPRKASHSNLTFPFSVFLFIVFLFLLFFLLFVSVFCVFIFFFCLLVFCVLFSFLFFFIGGGGGVGWLGLQETHPTHPPKNNETEKQKIKQHVSGFKGVLVVEV